MINTRSPHLYCHKNVADADMIRFGATFLKCIMSDVAENTRLPNGFHFQTARNTITLTLPQTANFQNFFPKFSKNHKIYVRKYFT